MLRAAKPYVVGSLVAFFWAQSGFAQTTRPSAPPTTHPAILAADLTQEIAWAGIIRPPGALLHLGIARFPSTASFRIIRFSPDDKRILTLGPLALLQVWNAESGQVALTLHPPPASTILAATYLDAKTIAVAAAPDRLLLVDALGGQILQRFDAKAGRVSALIASPDGKRMMIAGDRVLLWDPQEGRPITDLGTHGLSDPARRTVNIEFSRDSQTLLTVDPDGTIMLWDATAGRSLPAPAERFPRVAAATLRGDGRVIAANVNGELALLDAQTGQRRTLPAPVLLAAPPLRFSPTGSTLAYVDAATQTIRLWDEAQQQEVGRLPSASVFEWSGSGSFLAVASPSHMDLYATGTGQPTLRRFGHERPVAEITSSPDGREICTSDDRGWVIRWDAITGKVLPSPPHTTQARVQLLRYARNAQQLHLRTSTSQPLQIIDLPAMNVAREIPIHVPNVSVGETAIADNLQLAATRTREGLLRIWNPTSDSPEKIFRMPQPGRSIAAPVFSPDLSMVAVPNGDETLPVFNVQDGTVVRTLRRQQFGPSGKVLWSADGSAIAWEFTGQILLFDAYRWMPLRELRVPEKSCFAFSADGIFLAVGLAGETTVYEVATAARVARIPLTNFQPTCLTFFNNSHHLAVGFTDGTAMVFDIRALLANPFYATLQPQQLWSRFIAPASTEGTYSAGIELLKRPEELVRLAEAFFESQPEPDPAMQLVQQLSSANPAERERAHHELEQLGRSATAAVTLAMRNPPAGEAGERLRSLARLLQIKIESLDTSAPQRPPPPDFRTRRILQILEWSGDETARQLLQRLTNSRHAASATAALARLDARRAAATQPATRPGE